MILDDPHVPWLSSGDGQDGPVVHGRGYAFLGEEFARGQALVDRVQRHCRGADAGDSRARFRELVPTLNGHWALVAEWPDGHLIAAMDKLRSIPLLYAETAEGFILSCSMESVRERMPETTLNEDGALDYLLAGFVTGADTLWKGVKQMQAAEVLGLPPDGPVATHTYCRFLPTDGEPVDDEVLGAKVEALLDRIVARFVRAHEGRRIVVPLSGGGDSRMLAGLLKRHGARDVLCYTYGLPETGEVAGSRAVADALGYEWAFVEYDAAVWATWMASEDMRRFWDYSIRGSGLPLFQDVPAIAALAQDGRARDCVFVPGFVALSSGGTLPAWLLHRHDTRPRAAANYALRRPMALWLGADHRLPPNMHRALRARIESQMTLPDMQGPLPQAGLYEWWEHDNRQAKFMANVARGYEFIGHDWAFPLWDQELRDVYTALPDDERWQRRFYIRTLGRRIFRGDLQPLADIPLEDGQSVIGRASKRLTWRRRVHSSIEHAATEAACKLGLAVAIQKARRRIAPSPPNPLGFEYWFADGVDPAGVSARAVFERYDVRESLPPALWALLECHADRPIATCHCNGLLSAVTLAYVLGKGAP